MTAKQAFTSISLVDAMRATAELAYARKRLGAKSLAPQNRDRRSGTKHTEGLALDERQAALIGRVAFMIPRIAARVPWRADCLVQALAAERWLTSAGIATRLTIGVPKEKRPQFEAHAWLTAGGRIVTGGDVSGYVPLGKA